MVKPYPFISSFNLSICLWSSFPHIDNALNELDTVILFGRGEEDWIMQANL